MTVTFCVRRGDVILISGERRFTTRDEARKAACEIASRLEAQARQARAILEVKLV
jgi:uncharacterized protein YgbK (DUF1537 family)